MPRLYATAIPHHDERGGPEAIVGDRTHVRDGVEGIEQRVEGQHAERVARGEVERAQCIHEEGAGDQHAQGALVQVFVVLPHIEPAPSQREANPLAEVRVHGFDGDLRAHDEQAQRRVNRQRVDAHEAHAADGREHGGVAGGVVQNAAPGRRVGRQHVAQVHGPVVNVHGRHERNEARHQPQHHHVTAEACGGTRIPARQRYVARQRHAGNGAREIRDDVHSGRHAPGNDLLQGFKGNGQHRCAKRCDDDGEQRGEAPAGGPAHGCAPGQEQHHIGDDVARREVDKADATYAGRGQWPRQHERVEAEISDDQRTDPEHGKRAGPAGRLGKFGGSGRMNVGGGSGHNRSLCGFSGHRVDA